MASSSKIFIRNRALGYVSNHIPVVTRYIKRRREHLFVTSVGKSFHTYGSSHLDLLTISDLHPEEITCIAGDAYLIFSASGNKIYAWRRGTEVKHEYEKHESPVKLLLPFGPHLISIDENSHLILWDIKSTEIQLELEFSNKNFQITTVTHPSTYLNKILLGSLQGTLQLWNLNTSKLIYTFKGWNSGVNVVKQTPAIDVVGIGLMNGRIILHNLKFDETVMEFQQDWGIVTSLAFRMDKIPLMISGTVCGHLILWNLEEKIVFSQFLNAHDSSVTGLECLPNEPLMITNSPDNSLKLWIFDMPDGSPRLLIKREGHSLPPTFIRFHGSNGANLLSAGGDSHLRIFNTVTEKFNKTLGKASINRKKSKKKGRLMEDALKMPPIIRFTSETTREKEWDNIAAIHMNTMEVTTWSYDKVKMGDLKLIHERFYQKKGNSVSVKYNSFPVSLHLTHCGNFVLIGYTSGHCDRFNIQSGIHRATYGNDKAHEGPVRGVTVDILNRVVITGGGDKFIKWWNFSSERSGKEIAILQIDEGVSFFTTHNESSITAVALEDFSIIVIDNDFKNIIRKFPGHTGKITDAAFSPDSKWLITAGMDCCIFTWDIPSGCLIDHFKVDNACISLSFSPTGEYLATLHVENIGVFLWTNKTLYEHVTLKPVKNLDKIPLVALPSVGEVTVESEPNGAESDDDFKSPEQIEDLITLSTLPSSRWANLLNIDIIRRRNKPIDPIKVPTTAPFFLPTIPSKDITFDLSAAEKPKDNSAAILNKWVTLTAFSSSLKSAKNPNDFQEAFQKLKNMGPSAIDHEINSLATADPDTTENLLSQFMKMIKYSLERKIDFELTQAYLGLFLKIHGEAITENGQLLKILEDLKEIHDSSWKKLEKDLHYTLSLIKAFRLFKG